MVIMVSFSLKADHYLFPGDYILIQIDPSDIVGCRCHLVISPSKISFETSLPLALFRTGFKGLYLTIGIVRL